MTDIKESDIERDNSINIIEDMMFFTCPHCYGVCCVRLCDINCGIFRHGIKRGTYEQIDPHEREEVCKYLAENNKIIGCGKPFKIKTLGKNSYEVVICDYI